MPSEKQDISSLTGLGLDGVGYKPSPQARSRDKEHAERISRGCLFMRLSLSFHIEDEAGARMLNQLAQFHETGLFIRMSARKI